MNKISKIYNCSYIPIDKILKDNNIKMRSRNELIMVQHEQEIIDLYVIDKLSMNKISKIYNCSPTPINNILKRNNIKIRSLSEVQNIILPEKEIIDLYVIDKLSTNKISKIYNCSPTPINNILKRNNIKIRTKSEAHFSVDLPEQEIINLYINKVIPILKIANIYECSTTVIYNILKLNNIITRSISDPRNCTCIKCGCTFIGKGNSLYCDECDPNEYCNKYDEDCKEHNREKYNRECFFCGKSEEENGRKLDTHHVDNNKNQGCDEIPWKLVPLCKTCHGFTKGSKENRKIWEARILYLRKEYRNIISSKVYIG